MSDASVNASRPLVDITPDTLSFELFPDSQPGCVLYVSNAAGVTVAFKVKTTEPRRYLVRPNQGMIGPGEREAVNVYLIEKECNLLIHEGVQTPSSLGKVSDKFLVQTVGLGEGEASLLSSVAAAKQTEALTKIWATFNKTAIRNKKLNVRVSLASGAAKSLSAANNTAAASVAQSPARTVGSDSGGAAFASPGSQTSPSGVAARGAYGSRNGGVGSRGGVSRAGGVGGAGLDENSRVLANKYDDLVNYTANLTEERDELNASLEEAKKALQREMATRIALESKGQMQQGRKGSSRGGVRPPVNHQRDGGGGFGLVTLSVVASIFFFLGHWLDLASAGDAVTSRPPVIQQYAASPQPFSSSSSSREGREGREGSPEL